MKQVSILLSICFLIISCSTLDMIFIEKHTSRKIKLMGYNDSKSIVYDLDSVKLYIELNQTLNMIKQIDNLGSKENIYDQKKVIDMLSKAKYDLFLKDCKQKDSSANYDILVVSGFIDQFVLRDIIKKGQIKLLNKKTNEYEKIVIIHHDKFIIADELHDYYTFTLQNGMEFFRQIIAI